MVFGSKPVHWLPLQTCPFLTQGSKGHGFPIGFQLLHTEISLDSLNLFMILCSVDDIPKFTAILGWGTLFVNCCTIFPHSVYRSLSIFTAERQPVRGALFCNHYSTFFSLLLPLSQLFWSKLLASDSKWSPFFIK